SCAAYPCADLSSHDARAHRDLHSFPTRRSSDLGHGRLAGNGHANPTAIVHLPGGTPCNRVPPFPSRAPPPCWPCWPRRPCRPARDRKSTRLNSSHVKISYAVFCLKKKKKTDTQN